MPSEYIQNAIIAEIERYSSDKTVSILDVSCGDGEILKQLKSKGYTNLQGTLYGNDSEIYDYSSIDFDGIPVLSGVDILKSIPFENETFDIVINTELLTHLENHRKAMYELCRLVKKDGLLLFETPNISRLQSRFNFFLSGYHKPRNPIAGYHNPFSEHIYLCSYPIYLPMVDYFCYQFGMSFQKASWNKVRLFPIMLLILFYPLILLNTILFLKKEKIIDRETKKHIFNLTMNPAIQLCSVLILTYKKIDHCSIPNEIFS